MTIARRCIYEFDANPRYAAADPALRKLFTTFPWNTVEADVLLKVTALDSLYWTHLRDPVGLSQSIVSLSIDAALADGDSNVIADIRSAEPTGRDNYSFTTKYCYWH